MLTRQEKWFAVIQSFLFVFLFHNQPIGLNLLIYEIIIVAWMHYSRRVIFNKLNLITVYAGLLITVLAVVFSYSIFAIVINIMTFFLFVGLTLVPQIKSIPNALFMSFNNLFLAPKVYFAPSKEAGAKGGTFKYIWRFRIFIIPLAIIILFIVFYSSSNPIFNDLTVYIGKNISSSFNFVFSRVDGWIILTWLIGFFVAIFTVVRYINKNLLEKDQSSAEILVRKRQRRFGKISMVGLKDELKAAIFLLFMLNAIILVLNGIDIYSVWFNFKWEGEFLKDFVHTGTYILIISILVSIVIVLFFFRRNLNYYSKNKLLKILSYIWLAQNAVLVVSVAIRNFWYIHYFSLAYKRIGVIIFLILTLYGIYTVIIKVKNKKSGFYLVKSNSFALFVVMVLCTIPNWDVLIAKYNFRNYEKSFVHLDFLASLSDKALPYLDKTPEELENIQTYQDSKFSFRRHYMTSQEYHETIQRRKREFIYDWEHKGILSWNLPEYLAYRKLKATENMQ